jgi:hypothetical protein
VRLLLADVMRTRAEDPEAVRAPKNRKALYEVVKALEKAVKKTLKRGLPDSDDPLPASTAASTAAAAAASTSRTTPAASRDADPAAEPPKKKKKKMKAAEAAEAAVPADVSGLAIPSADEWSDGALADTWEAAAPMDVDEGRAGTPKSDKKTKKKKSHEPKEEFSTAPSTPAEPSTPLRSSLKPGRADAADEGFHTCASLATASPLLYAPVASPAARPTLPKRDPAG